MNHGPARVYVRRTAHARSHGRPAKRPMAIASILPHLTVGPYEEVLSPPKEIDALLNVAEEHPLPQTDRVAHKVPMTDMQPIPVDQLEAAVR